ncbi:MAG: HAD hydrolase-like protein [Filifactoraceae bacterium]
MKNKRLILFDLDGTLLDTSQGIFACFNYVCKKLNRPYPSEVQLRRFIGPPIKHSFIHNIGLTHEEAMKGSLLFQEEYNRVGIELSSIYDGIKNLLLDLKTDGYLLGVATLKPQKSSEKILAHHNISKYFDVIIGADLEGKYTKSQIMTMAMKELNISASSTVMVGDTCSDAIGAADLNVDFIPVSYGFGLKDNEVFKYPYIKMADKALDIKGIIQSISL